MIGKLWSRWKHDVTLKNRMSLPKSPYRAKINRFLFRWLCSTKCRNSKPGILSIASVTQTNIRETLSLFRSDGHVSWIHFSLIPQPLTSLPKQLKQGQLLANPECVIIVVVAYFESTRDCGVLYPRVLKAEDRELYELPQNNLSSWP